MAFGYLYDCSLCFQKQYIITCKNYLEASVDTNRMIPLIHIVWNCSSVGTEPFPHIAMWLQYVFFSPGLHATSLGTPRNMVNTQSLNKVGFNLALHDKTTKMLKRGLAVDLGQKSGSQ